MSKGNRATLTITIPTVGAGAAVALVAVAALGLYVWFKPARDELRFAVGAFATAGGIAAAYYIGNGLRIAAETERLSRTFSYPARFGAPDWTESRNALGRVLSKCLGKHETERLNILQEAIEDDENLSRHIVGVLNLLEELALAINLGLVDEAILERFYRTTVLRTYGLLAPWIRDRRDEHDAPRIWRELETLYGTWLKKANQ